MSPSSARSASARRRVLPRASQGLFDGRAISDMLQRVREKPADGSYKPLEIVGDTSDERIERLFCGQEHGAPEPWLILQALIASKDPRAVRLALRVGRSHRPDLWDDAFRFLATVRVQEVEDFFIDFLVSDEGQHPWLERIADDYLAESAR